MVSGRGEGVGREWRNERWRGMHMRKGMESRGRGVKSREMRGERRVAVNAVSGTQYSIKKDYSTHTYIRIP